MTVELITGFAGTPHIGSDDIGAFQAGLVGPGDYALTTGNQLKATMSNANTIAVQSGDAVLNGRHVHLTGTTTATVQSGTQGQKRNDIAVLRYSKNTTSGVETCQLVVIKGTPTTGTPADPAHNTGSILDGVATHDMPLYRVSLNGITVGTLVPLFNVLKPMKDMWDSLTQSSVSFTGPYAMNVLLMRIGRIVIAVGQPSPSSSYATGELKATEKIPEGYRPASYGSILFVSNNGGAVGSWYISSDGSITIRGKADKGYYQTCTGCWLTA
ncbi:MAG: hypothetical protein KH417_09285 [Bifidobacterium bifidum]|nr:hypothetical protein [Bifidobacterium bifidum]